MLVDSDHEYTILPIFYGTNRQPYIPNDPVQKYSHFLGDKIRYGVSLVRIPTTRKPGEIPTRLFQRFRTNTGDMANFTIISTIQCNTSDTFFQQVRDYRDQARREDAIVYIHGYNNSFADGVQRAAQIAYDLRFKGPMLLYSWPAGNPPIYFAGYNADLRNANNSKNHLKSFLTDVVAKTGAKRIHLIAHSMGNHLLSASLDDFPRDLPDQSSKPFTNIIMAAPDVDANEFITIFSANVIRCASAVTIYASKNDKPLSVACKFWGNNRRLGQADPCVNIKGIDTIDASAVETDFLTHAYVGDSSSIISDLFLLIFDNRPAADRCMLTKSIAEPHWVFNPITREPCHKIYHRLIGE